MADTRVDNSKSQMPILTIEDLTISYKTNQKWQNAIRNFTLSIQAGETHGLVGESGSGKTTVVMAIMRYLSKNGRVESGTIRLEDRDLLAASHAELSNIWGKSITMVPQDPLSALNPSIKIGEQLSETLRHHLNFPSAQANAKTIELLDMVHIADPERIMNSYPHQISGGMQQRVMIAMALSTEPKLLILDEPTTNLDVTTQAVVLDLIRELIQGRQTAALYVTHNLGVVAQLCDRVSVLYAGELVEDGYTRDIFNWPVHPYTKGLLDCIPQLGENKTKLKLRPIPGQIPSLGERSEGCIFADRCPLVVPICSQRPELLSIQDNWFVRCHRWEEIRSGSIDARHPSPEASEFDQLPSPDPVLSVRNLKVDFPLQRSLKQILQRLPAPAVRAVDGVDLSVNRTRTLGLVGESGSGKTTFARAVAGLVTKTSGEVSLLNIELPSELSDRSKDSLRHLQMVFQNPEDALNPYLTVGETLSRPLKTLLDYPQHEINNKVLELLSAVQLPAIFASRTPSQLSGGEKQRVAIARAFASNPNLLICDEPVSSLDVSVQASILNLLNILQIENESSILFISHDLAVVGFLADDIAVIYMGQLMQISNTQDLFSPPYHPYTEALLSAIPHMNPGAQQERIRLRAELPNLPELGQGCPFRTRCPRNLGNICEEQTPPWQEGDAGKRIFCHIPLPELTDLQTPKLGKNRLHPGSDRSAPEGKS